MNKLQISTNNHRQAEEAMPQKMKLWRHQTANC